MSDLKRQAELARQHQTFKEPIRPTSTAAVDSPSQQERTKREPSTRTKKKRTKRALDGPTGNELARQASGVEPPPPAPTKAERQAARRRTLAVLTVELLPEQKAELIKAADQNGRTLKDEVLARLFGRKV